MDTFSCLLIGNFLTSWLLNFLCLTFILLHQFDILSGCLRVSEASGKNICLDLTMRCLETMKNIIVRINIVTTILMWVGIILKENRRCNVIMQ